MFLHEDSLLREQLATSGGNRRDKSPVVQLERDELPDTRRKFAERSQREKSASSLINPTFLMVKDGVFEVFRRC